MKLSHSLLLTVGIALAPHAHAALLVVNSPVLNQTIPDGQAAGFPFQLTLDAPSMVVQSVKVHLWIEGTGTGAFSGDYYAAIVHEDTRSVLLNRPGVTAVNPIGYTDNGLNVTFDDSASFDIHNYRQTFVPAGSQPVTGIWQPDARAAQPSVVTDASPRTLFLSQFAGLDAGGSWFLIVADNDIGGTGRLVQWGLEITAVPEPALGMAAAGLALLGFAWIRRSTARRSES